MKRLKKRKLIAEEKSSRIFFGYYIKRGRAKRDNTFQKFQKVETSFFSKKKKKCHKVLIDRLHIDYFALTQFTRNLSRKCRADHTRCC